MGIYELFTKIKAFTSTLAYTNIDQVIWFDYAACEFFLENVFAWVHRRHKGVRPPISFFKDAFKLTMAVFQNAVKEDQTLKAAVENLNGYQHFWIVFVPDNAQKTDNQVSSASGRKRRYPDEAGSSGTSRPDMTAAQELLRRMQSEKDRQITTLTKQLQESKKDFQAPHKQPRAGGGGKDWGGYSRRNR